MNDLNLSHKIDIRVFIVDREKTVRKRPLEKYMMRLKEKGKLERKRKTKNGSTLSRNSQS